MRLLGVSLKAPGVLDSHAQSPSWDSHQVAGDGEGSQESGVGRTQGTLKVKRGEWNLGPKGKHWWLLGSRTEPGGEGGDTEAERSEVTAPPS